MTKTHILYLQLPLLDNDTQAERENFPFAGAYLDHALKNSSEASFHTSAFAPTDWDELDTPHLAQAILSSGADIIVCTLYLWNIERTLQLAEQLKKAAPQLRLLAGGPETAKEHPLLFNTHHFDAVITGEGEAVFPALLHAWRTGTDMNFENVATHRNHQWHWGSQPAPPVDLMAAQPPAETIMRCVQNRPVIYLETVRGCPLTCSYCRYYQLHTGLRMLTTEQVLARIQRFRELGATEIRFVDPTFNARPRFTEFLKAIAELNADQHLSFFAEIRSDTLTAQQAQLMKAANFTAVEVGVQSIDPDVLQNVARPVRLEKTAAGIQALCNAGVHVVLDIMYGLPGQTLAEVQQSLNWGLAFGSSVQVQCMQTLVLPGTVLRQETSRWGFQHEKQPPYNIQQTAHLAPDDIIEIETLLDEHPHLPADPVTPRFCGQRLRGLFRAQHRLSPNQLSGPIPGQYNRRTLLIECPDLIIQLSAIQSFIHRAIESDPFTLWQFVLLLEQEEPLDLIEQLAHHIRKQPTHLLDRFASASAFHLTVSRRLYLRHAPPLSSEWTTAAENLLRETFG